MSDTTTRRSGRKPHNHLDGYVAERRSRHPRLPGHFVVFDRERGGDWVTGADGLRWGVAHINGESVGGVVTLNSLQDARALVVDMANGSDVADFGQHA